MRAIDNHFALGRVENFGDLDPRMANLILVDTVELRKDALSEDSKVPELSHKGPSNALKNALVQHFGREIPCVGFTTGLSQKSAIEYATAFGLQARLPSACRLPLRLARP